MKRFDALLLCLILLVFCRSAGAEEGVCGKKLAWSYAGGVLTITGTGAMDNWQGYPADTPWSAFRDQITRVVIGKGVTTVGDNAFFRCRSLVSVSFPATLRRIGTQAFSMTNLTELKLPKGLTEIGSLAFQEIGAASLTLPDALKTVGVNAFNNCKQLTTVVIGARVSEMPVNPFSGCEALRSMTVSAKNAHYRTQAGYLIDTRDSRLVFAPYGQAEMTVPQGVAIIGQDSFIFNRTVRRVTLPDSVLLIGDNAFQNCVQLEEINLPEGLTSLRYRAFQRTSSLRSITLPSTLSAIGEGAFEYSGLTSLTIPQGVEGIDAYTFFGCEALTELHLPASVQRIDLSAFERCADKLTIWAPKGSFALGFARENSLRYRAEKQQAE